MSVSRRSTLALAAALFTVTLAGACADSTAPRAGKVSILLTDAPGDIKAAVVTIDRIYLQGSENDSSGRVVLREDDMTTDLLTLANSTAGLVDGVTVPGGNYSQLRFVISGAYIEVENADGSTSIYASSPTYAGLPAGATVAGNLQMPSIAQTGIKVNLAGGSVSVDGDQKVLLVDFDVSKSFGHEAGGSGQWVMHPVITGGSITFSGSVKARVTKADSVTLPSINGTPLTLANFKAVLSDGNGGVEKLALSDSNSDGTYEANFLFKVPGAYQLSLEAPSDSVVYTTTPTLPVAVTVTSGGAPTQAIQVTSAHK